jgi:adenine phosphoribosyltransferase
MISRDMPRIARTRGGVGSSRAPRPPEIAALHTARRAGDDAPTAMHRLIQPLIRDIADFPRSGIVFKDITPLRGDPAGLALAVELMANPFRKSDIEAVVGAESRGFIFGTAIAQALSVGFVPIRKPGKLPAKRLSVDYALEYGTDTLEIHADALRRGQRVLMVDDLLATGGTMRACVELVRRLEADIVGASFLIELEFLNGREGLKPVRVESVVKY